MKKSLNFKSLAIGLMATFALSQTPLALSAQSNSGGGYKNYVTDKIQIPFRSGPGYKYKIDRMIYTGTAVKVLEINKQKWAKISYVDKKNRTHIGWMPSSLLQTQPVSRYQLVKEINHNKKLEQDKIVLSDEINQLTERLKSAQTELNRVNKDTFELKQDYKRLKEISGNAVNIGAENETLKKQLAEVSAQNEIYQQQLNQAEDVVQRQWFLTGGGVLLLGIILGLFFRSPRKKKGWDTL